MEEFDCFKINDDDDYDDDKLFNNTMTNSSLDRSETFGSHGRKTW